jgi:hypothetical protein
VNIDADGGNGRSRAALCLVLLARGIGTVKPLLIWIKRGGVRWAKVNA